VSDLGQGERQAEAGAGGVYAEEAGRGERSEGEPVKLGIAIVEKMKYNDFKSSQL